MSSVRTSHTCTSFVHSLLDRGIDAVGYRKVSSSRVSYSCPVVRHYPVPMLADHSGVNWVQSIPESSVTRSRILSAKSSRNRCGSLAAPQTPQLVKVGKWRGGKGGGGRRKWKFAVHKNSSDPFSPLYQTQIQSQVPTPNINTIGHTCSIDFLVIFSETVHEHSLI